MIGRTLTIGHRTEPDWAAFITRMVPSPISGQHSTPVDQLEWWAQLARACPKLEQARETHADLLKQLYQGLSKYNPTPHIDVASRDSISYKNAPS